jgi:hypothetical protein
MGKPLLTENHAPGATLIVNIPPENRAKFRETLTQIFGTDAVQQAIESVGTVHFFRWVLFDNDSKFLFMAIFDGEFDKYFEDFQVFFAKLKIPPLLSLAEDFPKNGLENIESFKKWVHTKQIDSMAEFSSYPGATMRDVRKGLAVREHLGKALDQMQ